MARGPRRIKCPTEAALVTTELVAALQWHRPEWLLARPDMRRWHQLSNHWQRKMWMWALTSDELHARVRARAERHQQLLPRLKEEQDALRRMGHDAADLADLFVMAASSLADEYAAGWSGDRIAAWRLDLRDQWMQALCTREDPTEEPYFTLHDWASCRLDIAAIRRDRVDFSRLWLKDIEPADVPRDYMRWAFRLAQASKRIEAGNLVDNQHSAYLLDADYFVTADKRFTDALEIMRPQVSAGMARTLRVTPTGPEDVVGQIRQALTTPRLLQ
jgi:hypothetical protein